jgi:hypothetical protein
MWQELRMETDYIIIVPAIEVIWWPENGSPQKAGNYS